MNISLMKSAMKFPNVKRIIITSSLVSLLPVEWYSAPDTERVYTSKEINANPGRTASSSMEAYWNSKGLARHAVRDFIKENNPHFETIQLMPSVIIGADDRATSTSDLFKNTPDWEMRMSPLLGVVQQMPIPGAIIDVADVSKAHVDAIKSSVPGNAEYILSADAPEGSTWDSMIDIAKKYWPERCGSAELPLGGTMPTMKWQVDTSDTVKAFGWKFQGFEETMKGMTGQYLALIDAEKKCKSRR